MKKEKNLKISKTFVKDKEWRMDKIHDKCQGTIHLHFFCCSRTFCWRMRVTINLPLT